MTIARVQTRGQVTIPQEIRDACGIEPGAQLVFLTTGAGGFECHVIPSGESLMDVVSEYTVPGVAPNLDALREEMGDEIAREYDRPDERAQRTARPCRNSWGG